MRALLTAGAKSDVNVLFRAKHESALHVAAARGAEEATTALVMAGARPNVVNVEEFSPLHIATGAGHDRVIDVLLLNGAEVNAETNAGDTPLHLAASKGHTLCISELLMGGADKDVIDHEGETPLFKAARNNHLGAVVKLLAAGADPGILSYSDVYPLEIAARRGHATIMKVFLDEDSSNVDATDNLGWTALHHAASVGGPARDSGDAVRVLLEAGADVNTKTTGNNYFTPLHVAASQRGASMGTIRALLEGGLNANGRDKLDETPLHIACMIPSVAAVELLLLWGADEKLTDDDGDTPADVKAAPEENDNNEEEIEADNQRIRQMLARAPAERSWRRRGWLVLSRSCPTRVQIANGSSSGSLVGSSKGCCAKVARVSGEGSGEHDEEAEDQMMVDWRDLVGRIVG
ncbi:unnamed protein product [Ectocarpus sp. 12 AP-2014]